jgi:hypothetical protein
MKKKLHTYSADHEAMFRYLHELLPNFLILFDPSPKDLEKITLAFEKRLEFYKTQLASQPSFYVENCLIDLLWRAKEHDLHAMMYLKFIDSQCAVIMNHVGHRLWPRFKNALSEMFLNHDNEHSRMNCYVAELCVCAKFVGSGAATLVAVEERMSNGKSLDFKFEVEGVEYYVEVESIEVDASKLHSVEDVKTFLERRAIGKFSEKIGSLEKPSSPINLTQVLWGRIADLSPFAEYFTTQDTYRGIWSPLMIVAELTDTRTGGPIYEFLMVRDYLEKVIEGKNRENP